MNILVVTQYFWPESFRINDLVSGLVEKGHDVTVLTGIPNYPGGKFFNGYTFFKNIRQNYNGANIVRIPLVPRGRGGGVRLAINYLTFALFSCVFGPFLCKKNYDFIFVYQPSPITVGLPALVLRKIKCVPIFFWVQDLWPETLSATGAVRNEQILGLVGSMVRFIYRRCDRILIQSPAFAPLIERHGVPADKIFYFPNSVEKVYHPVAGHDASTPQLFPDGFKVVFAGNIGAAQDFGTILSAAEKLKEHPHIQWIIIGDGRKLEWVRDQVAIRGLADCVHLLGRYPLEAMNSFFAQADALLVTLKRDPIFATTIPSKIQSYMACGKPIIAALDGEGGRLIMESGSGLAAPAENPDALAQAVLSLAAMPEEQRADMGRRGRVYCEENFERDMLIEKLESWMRATKDQQDVGVCTR